MPPARNPQTQKIAFGVLALVFLVFTVLAVAGGNTLLAVFAALIAAGNAFLAYKLHTLRS